MLFSRSLMLVGTLTTNEKKTQHSANIIVISHSIPLNVCDLALHLHITQAPTHSHNAYQKPYGFDIGHSFDCHHEALHIRITNFYDELPS